MLKKPTPGLKRLHNKSLQVAKVQVNVGPYDELEVSEDVAAQLQASSSAFAEGPAPAWPKEWDGPGDEVEGSASDEPAKLGKKAPAKRTAKKR